MALSVAAAAARSENDDMINHNSLNSSRDVFLFGGNVPEYAASSTLPLLRPTSDIFRVPMPSSSAVHSTGQYMIDAVEYKDRLSHIHGRLLPSNADNRCGQYEALCGAPGGRIYVLEKHSRKLSVFDTVSERFVDRAVCIFGAVPTVHYDAAITHLFKSADNRVKVVALSTVRGVTTCQIYDADDADHMTHNGVAVVEENGDAVVLRMEASAVHIKLQNKLIIYGGKHTQDDSNVDNVLELDMNSMVARELWRSVDEGEGKKEHHFPKARYGCVLHATKDESRIIMYGGTEQIVQDSLEEARLLEVFNDVWMFCLLSRQWTRIDPWLSTPTSSPLPRSSPASVMIDTEDELSGVCRILVSGGIHSHDPMHMFDNPDHFFSVISVMSPDMTRNLMGFKGFLTNPAFSDVTFAFQN